MRRGRGIFWIVLGLLLIVAALCLALYNFNVQYTAGAEADRVLEELETVIPDDAPDPDDEEAPPYYVVEPHIDMPTVPLDGRKYIGVLEIPKLELRLPVLSEWSYDGLAVSPCRYSGSVYLGDMVICAHNYNTYFGKLATLQPEDEVYFTDMSGNRFIYSVGALETLEPTQVQDMRIGDWDLTLFTCTVGGRARVAVRCEREN